MATPVPMPHNTAASPDPEVTKQKLQKLLRQGHLNQAFQTVTTSKHIAQDPPFVLSSACKFLAFCVKFSGAVCVRLVSRVVRVRSSQPDTRLPTVAPPSPTTRPLVPHSAAQCRFDTSRRNQVPVRTNHSLFFSVTSLLLVTYVRCCVCFCRYLQNAVMHLDHSSGVVLEHIPSVLGQLTNKLTTFAQQNANHPMQRQFRMLQLAVRSIIDDVSSKKLI